MNKGSERVEGFVYSGEKLNAEDGCLSAVISSLCVGWGKFIEIIGAMCGKNGQRSLRIRCSR